MARTDVKESVFRVNSRLVELTGGDLLRLEVKEQNAIADACGVVRLGNLERHEAAICGDHWI